MNQVMICIIQMILCIKISAQLLLLIMEQILYYPIDNLIILKAPSFVNIYSYQGYNYKIEKAKCKCTVKEEIEIKFNKTLFLSYFKLDKYTNFKLLKCYELVFSKLGQKNNTGSYIFIAIIFFYISLFVIFYIYQTKSIAKIIRTIINTNFSNTNVNYLSSPTKKTIKRIKSDNDTHIRKNHFKKSNTIKKLKTKDLIRFL